MKPSTNPAHRKLFRKWLLAFLARLLSGVVVVYGINVGLERSWNPLHWPTVLIAIDAVIILVWLILCSWFHYIFFAIDADFID